MHGRDGSVHRVMLLPCLKALPLPKPLSPVRLVNHNILNVSHLWQGST